MSARIVLIGCSHLVALMRAFPPEADGTVHIGEFAVQTLPLVNELQIPAKKIVQNDGTAQYVFNEEIGQAIARATEGATLVVSFIGGNAHNYVTLVESERPFDFVLAENPSIPLLPDREILPERYFRLALEASAEAWVNVLRSVRRYYSGPLWHVESPPPVKKTEDVTSKTMKVSYKIELHERIEQLGVAPATLRYKAWRVHSAIYRATIEELGGKFLEAPKEAQDEEGYLFPSLIGLDACHGDDRYGRMVAAQLVSLFSEAEKQAENEGVNQIKDERHGRASV